MTLEGRRVRLEPLELRHEEALWAIAQDPRVWTLMRVRGHESREAFHDWFESIEAGFAHYLDGELVGHTSFLNDRPGDRVVEIGNTWLDSAWYAVIDDDWPEVKANLERRLGWRGSEA